MKIKIYLVIVALIFLYACGSKKVESPQYPISDNLTQEDNASYYKELEELIEKVNNNSITICSYKNKAIFEYNDEKIKVKMKGAVNKDCDNNGEINIFGPFGVVLYNAKYQNGVLELKKDNEYLMLNNKSISKISEMIKYLYLFNYPGIRPTRDFTFVKDNDEVIFNKDNVTIYAKDYKINKIDIDNLTVHYNIKDGTIKEILLINRKNHKYLKINFD